ncbi:MAG TPA: hypothetical protein PLN01_00865 [Spirochaetota bacterium]|nr:hypothetical protein [Spirochaetota bacterium]
MLDEKKLISQIQIAVPVTKRPYRVLADTLGTTEYEVINTVQKLKQDGLIRSIAGIFDAKKLGYTSNLVAFAIPEPAIAHGVAIINALPGVSHNYLRDGAYNIWFTLALPEETNFIETVQHLAEQVNAVTFNIFQAVLTVKLSARFFEDDSIHDNNAQYAVTGKHNETIPVDDTVKNTVKVLQCDLPCSEEPFDQLIAQSNIPMDVDLFIATANRLLENGMMRSYRAVVKHHAMGFVANAMTVWKADGDKRNSMLEQFANENAISHLYVREAYPNQWDYPVFAMVHAKSEDELDMIIKKLYSIAKTDYMSYRSLQEFKKERVRYFE